MQIIDEHNVAHGATVALGTATLNGDGTYGVSLKNAFSYLRFKIQNEDVKEIVLSGNDVNIAGTASFSVADASVSGTVGSVSTIRASFDGGYFSKDDDYYITVLPCTVPELSFLMVSNTHSENSGTEGYDDWKAERVASSALTFPRGTGIKFDELDCGDKWSWYFDIHDAASLERYRALVAAGKFPEDGVVRISGDIDPGEVDP